MMGKATFIQKMFVFGGMDTTLMMTSSFRSHGNMQVKQNIVKYSGSRSDVPRLSRVRLRNETVDLEKFDDDADR
jgi:hypothetical protein